MCESSVLQSRVVLSSVIASTAIDQYDLGTVTESSNTTNSLSVSVGTLLGAAPAANILDHV